MTNLNLWLLDGEALVKYYHPQTENEAVLFNALKGLLQDKDWKETEIDDEIYNLNEEITKLTDENFNLDSQLDKYKDFYGYISAAYDKIDGTWPKCEIDNDNWTQAIYDHIVNNPLKTDEG
jgi:hypothetical protein